MGRSYSVEVSGRAAKVWISPSGELEMDLDLDAEMLATRLTSHLNPLVVALDALRHELRASTSPEKDLEREVGYLDERMHERTGFGDAGMSSLFVIALAAGHPMRPVREGAARAPQATALTHELLAADPTREVRMLIAERALDPDLQRRLFADPDRAVRRALARNPAVTRDLLVRLVKDGDSWVAETAVRNERLPEKERAQALEQQQLAVRVAVSVTTRGLIKRLAADSRWHVRAGLASNLKAPEEVLLQLADDPDTRVRAALARRSRVTRRLADKLLADPEVKVRLALASNHQLGFLLDPLARDRSSEVRVRLAANEQLNPAALATLARDKEPKVRASAAANLRQTANLLASMIDDPDYDVRLAVASNPRTRYDQFHRFKVGGARRRRLARRTDTPPELLASFAKDADVRVRIEVASNIATPEEVLEQLAQEKYSQVPGSALSTLNQHRQSRARADALERAADDDELGM